MQTITTKYLGPTNYRGSRIKASTTTGIHITRPFNHVHSGVMVHAVVAMELAKSLGWQGQMIAGDTRTGYVFVFSSGERFDI
ncbi:hypothetical protein G3I67_14430 [Orrella sp. NBD-18]|uniref:Uncharacterized protein n=1 Tax=Sheuella amnicola TaxID=2707330 RepID=A0A6B2R0Y5_9BURK|nr:hypothetical protein [Sheuella amnicola]NDY84426.1 hypothetical protein [Sheuella amnicola]